MKKRKVFKVVKRIGVRGPDETTFRSYIAFGKAEVVYTLDQPSTPPKWLKANGMGLLVFESEARAREFIKENVVDDLGGYKILEGEALSPQPPAFRLHRTAWLADGELLLSFQVWPRGTLATMEFTPRRIIEI